MPKGCGGAGAHPWQGPTWGRVGVSRDWGVQPAALTTGCSLRGSLWSVPPLTLLWGVAHTCHPSRSEKPALEGTGCSLSRASTAPGTRRHMAPQHQMPAGTPPRAAHTHMAGRLEAPSALHLGLWGTSPAPSCAPCAKSPPIAQHCNDMPEALASSASKPVSIVHPTAAMPGTSCGDAWHPPQ